MRELMEDEIELVGGGESAVIVAGEVIGGISVVAIGTGVAIAIAPIGIAAAAAYITGSYLAGYAVGWLATC